MSHRTAIVLVAVSWCVASSAAAQPTAPAAAPSSAAPPPAPVYGPVPTPAPAATPAPASAPAAAPAPAPAPASAPAPAPASTPSSANAETYFRQGVAAMQAARHAEAIQAFEASYALRPLPLVLFNLGIAHSALDHPHEAVAVFERYLHMADPHSDATNITAVRAEIARIRQANTVLTLQMSVPNATVSVDGRAVVPLRGSELLVAPGQRVLAAEAPGYYRYEQRFDFVPGHFLIEVVLQAAPLAAAPAPVPPPTTQPPPPRQPPVAQPAPLDPELAQLQRGEDEPAAEDGPQCAGGSWCLGPMVAVGVPGLLGIGFHARGEHLGLGIDLHWLPTLDFGQASVGSTTLNVAARVFPFGGAFFLSGGFGLYTLTASASQRDPIAQSTIEIEGSVTFPSLSLGLGLGGRDGFVLGVDLALLIPLGSKTLDLTVLQGDPNSLQVQLVQQDVQDDADTILDALPVVFQVNLIRLGYLF